MNQNVQFIGKGLLRAVRGPALLRAIVGPGYGICLTLEDKNVGAILHVPSDTFADSGRGSLLAKRVRELRAAVEALDPTFRGAEAIIVGGADVMRLFGSQVAQRRVENNVAVIRTHLDEIGVYVKGARVGGKEARRVELLLPGGFLDTRVMSRGRRQWVEIPGSSSDAGDGLGSSSPEAIMVDMGCLKIAQSPTKLAAVLGSCVGLAVYDPATKTGGLAHVMLPERDTLAGEPAKFADTALAALLESLRQRGITPGGLVAKLSGGANVLPTRAGVSTQDIGTRNLEQCRRALNDAGVEVVWESTGGKAGRKILVDFEDFSVGVKFLPTSESQNNG